MRARRRWNMAAAMAMAMTAACGTTSEEGSTDIAADTAAVEPAGGTEEPAVEAGLEGTSWRLVGYGLDEPVPDGIEITAEFAEGRIAGRSACNRYTGPVEIDAAAGTLEAGALVSTKMACPPPQMESETRYLGVLQGVARYELADERLTLHAADGSTLVFERAEVAP
jgi:heat shock protein HslJ